MNIFKKGFTLIELLIVMVIVAVMITVALPQYKVAMEKGRAMEGLHNVQAMSEAANVAYIKNYNAYPSEVDNNLYAGTQSKFFNISVNRKSASELDVNAVRSNLGDNGYTISFTNKDGEITTRSCSSSSNMGQRYCKTLGIDQQTVPSGGGGSTGGSGGSGGGSTGGGGNNGGSGEVAEVEDPGNGGGNPGETADCENVSEGYSCVRTYLDEGYSENTCRDDYSSCVETVYNKEGTKLTETTSRCEGEGNCEKGVTKTYDDKGNVISETNNETGTTIDYIYDEEGRLTQKGDTYYEYGDNDKLAYACTEGNCKDRFGGMEESWMTRSGKEVNYCMEGQCQAYTYDDGGQLNYQWNFNQELDKGIGIEYFDGQTVLNVCDGGGTCKDVDVPGGENLLYNSAEISWSSDYGFAVVNFYNEEGVLMSQIEVREDGGGRQKLYNEEGDLKEETEF